jgi:hypothetical protein
MKMVPSDLKRCPRKKRPGELRIFSCPEPACTKRFFAPHDDRPSPSGRYGITVPDLLLPRLAERTSIGDPDPRSGPLPVGAFPPRRFNAVPLWYRKAHLPKRPAAPLLPALGTPTADHRFGPALLGRLAIPKSLGTTLILRPIGPSSQSDSIVLMSHTHDQWREPSFR